MRYQIRFDAEIAAGALRRALGRRFGIHPGAVYVGRLEDRPVTAERPTAVVTPPEGGEDFGWVLIARDGSYGPVIVDEDAAAEGEPAGRPRIAADRRFGRLGHSG